MNRKSGYQNWHFPSFCRTIVAVTLLVAAPTSANEPKSNLLQAKLEQAAAGVKPQRNQYFEITGATAGPKQLIINHKVTAGADAESVADEFAKTKWEGTYCKPASLLKFMKSEKVSIKLVLETSPERENLHYVVDYNTCSKYATMNRNNPDYLFGYKPTPEQASAKIRAFLEKHLKDPMSAQISCGEISNKAWVWRGLFFKRQYGYLVICNVNAKNSFGGYVGSQKFVFRFNGDEFSHEDVVPDMGLLE